MSGAVREPVVLGIVDYQEAEDIIIQAQNAEQVQAVLDGAGAGLGFSTMKHTHVIQMTRTAHTTV